MIKWSLNREARKFGRRYAYDTQYMQDVIDVSSSAGIRLAAFSMLTQYRGPKAARGIWGGALLASTLEGDCGPCVQLALDMTVEVGVSIRDLHACLAGQVDAAGDVGLGYRFANATITGDFSADTLRDEIRMKYGEKAVISASFAAASGRMYPVLKRGLGHGHACHALILDGETIALRQPV